MNRRVSFVLGLSNNKRFNEVATLRTKLVSIGIDRLINVAYSYISGCALVAIQSSIGPVPCRLLTAEASCLRVSRMPPKLSCFETVNFPKALTTKLLPVLSHEKETLMVECVCSCKNNGNRSNIRLRISSATLVSNRSVVASCVSRTTWLSLREPSCR